MYKSNKLIEMNKESKKNNPIIHRDLRIYLKRISRGESEKSATAGLSLEFIEYLEEEERSSRGIKLSSPEIPETVMGNDGKTIGVCDYCFPRGERGVKKINQCELCNGWFCEDHIRSSMSKGDNFGHPCPKNIGE